MMLVLPTLIIRAQDHLISFTGTGSSSVVTAIKVNNLRSGVSLTLNGGDILHLKAPSAIEGRDPDNDALVIYPNPMDNQSLITFIAPGTGNAEIRIVDLTGKTNYRTISMLSGGKHTFLASGINEGIYFVSISGNNYHHSGKLISRATNNRIMKIEDISHGQNEAGFRKNMGSIIDMEYINGDQIIFEGISGIYSTIVPDVPIGSKTITFTFVPCTDAANNNYPTVHIGNQTWMASNLNYGTRINGSWEQTDNSVVEKYSYKDIETNCDEYGGLYQWNEVMQYSTAAGTRGICPTDWHVPTNEQWTILRTSLGGTLLAGGRMKETGTIHWGSPNTDATNSSGFTGLPGGYRDMSVGGFYYMNDSGHFWTSTESSSASVWYWSLGFDNAYLGQGEKNKLNGYSVRCLKNN